MSPILIAASALVAAFAVWMLWYVWWFVGRPLVVIMLFGALIGIGQGH